MTFGDQPSDVGNNNGELCRRELPARRLIYLELVGVGDIGEAREIGLAVHCNGSRSDLVRPPCEDQIEKPDELCALEL